MDKKKAAYITITAILCFLIVRFFLPGSPFMLSSGSPLNIRVRVLNDVRSFEMSCEGRVKIVGSIPGEEKVLDPDNKTAILISSSNGLIIIDGKGQDGKEVTVRPLSGKCIKINNVPYRGDIVVRLDKERLDVIDLVDIELYLKGVVPKEVNPYWPFEAVKAQAIAARSYAVHEAARSTKRSYDVTNDIYTQVYGGMNVEKWRTSKAVDATKGMVLVYKGKVFPAYYHSCCGGHTRNSSSIWNIKISPLNGVRCEWCRFSPYYRWKVRIPEKELEEKLKKNGYPVASIKNITTGGRDGSGRINDVVVKSGRNWLNIPVEDFRRAVGRYRLKSAAFQIKKYPQFYLFSGYGWGHGVGMCQWGAFGLAFKGVKAEKILETYYPGTKLTYLKDIRAE